MFSVMLDFETLNTTADAIVVQIGAVKFDQDGNILETFEYNLDIQSEIDHGFTMSADTLCWWMQQSDEARNAVFAERSSITSDHAFLKLNLFLNGAETIWCHNMDIGILGYHLSKLGIIPSYHYCAPKDLRTLVEVSGIDHKSYENDGIAHNAVDDCKYQIKYTIDALKKVKNV